ncbi:MAG: DUF5615 family PIN-like protein [Dissulfurispiraceae bacterium]|jgi:predicted nuclease of predicted toxin-antitoxin system
MPDKHRLFLDQMLQERVAEALRKEGYDVVRASETGDTRTDDSQILQKAILDNRILITLDEHFGDWVLLPLSRHPGVLRLKVHPTTTNKIVKVLLPFLRMHREDKFKNRLVILSENRARWIATSA